MYGLVKDNLVFSQLQRVYVAIALGVGSKTLQTIGGICFFLLNNFFNKLTFGISSESCNTLRKLMGFQGVR